MLPSNRLDPDINFKYGTCLLLTGDNKNEALPYLNFASSKNADPRVHFFLGKTYHLLYKFGEAQKHYKEFKAKGSPADLQKYEVDLHIRMTQNGKKLLNNLTELIVDDKVETSSEKFPYSYDLSEMGGRIIISEEFQSKYDAKVGFRSMTYIPPLGKGNDVIFYASYGKDGQNGLDLYARKRLPNGDWGDPQMLPGHINTPYDDAYGFLHSSQTVFYFCSKGHNSMGGFDVFKCSYDISTNSFGPPVNLDYKINTPDDELMYVVDSLEQNAYFASSRATKYGLIDVYKVRVETYPIVNVLLAGVFDNKINNEDIATIKIQDTRNSEIIGIYNPNSDGKYTIILPKSGNYNFIVETEQSEKIHTSPVIIPPQKEFRPLKQKILLTNEGGVEKLIIQNLFDEEFDEEERERLLAEAMQILADPDINSGEFNDVITNVDVDSVLDGSNVRLEDLVDMSQTMYEDAQAEADEVKERMEAAFSVANAKSKEASENAKLAEELLNTLDEIDNPMERQQQASLAKELNNKAKDQYIQATTAYNLGNSLTDQHAKSQKEADESKLTFESIQSAVAEEDHEKAFTQLNELKERLENIISAGVDTESESESIAIRAKEAKDLALKELDQAKEYRKEEEALGLRLNNLKREYDKSSAKDKPSVQVQIDEIEEQIAMNGKWAEESYAKAEKLDQEADILSHQAQLLEDLAYDLDNETTAELSEEEKAALSTFMKDNSIESGISNTSDALNKINNTGNGTSDVTDNTNNNGGNGTSDVTDNSDNTNNNGGNGTSDVTDNTDNTNNNGGNGTSDVTDNTDNTNNNGGNGTSDVTDNTDNTNNNGGNGTSDVADNPDNTNNNGGNGTSDVTDNTDNTNNNGGNGTSDVTDNTDNTDSSQEESPSTAKVNKYEEIIAGFNGESRLKDIDNNNSLSPSEKLEKKNEVLQDLVDKYDYKIVEVNRDLLQSDNSEERDNLMVLRKKLDGQRDDYENAIIENDQTLASTAPSVGENSSDELKEIINETRQNISSPEDFTSLMAEEGSYMSQDAADAIAKTKDDRDVIIIKEQEKSALEDDLASETKEKKQVKIQNEIDLKTDEIAKYELLVRLKHEEKIYSPIHFLDAAEFSGQLYNIFKFMFAKGCEQAAKTGMRFSVNIGDSEFLNEDILDFIRGSLKEHNVNAKLLSLEVLENNAISHDGRIKDVILQIHELGIEIIIDDFGINCSNFGQIESLPVDILKIDGSFIKNLPKSENSKVIVKTIKTFANEKNIKLVAEFVCDKEVYDIVKELDIDYAQGYYLHEPSPEIK